MKKVTPLLMAFLMLLTLCSNSCDEDILDVDITTSMTEVMDLNLNQGIETISETRIIDLKNDDTRQYINKIKHVTIKKLTYKIISFNGDGDGTISGKVYAGDFSFGPESYNIKEAFDNQTIFEITDLDELNSISELLKKNKQLSVSVNGESNCPNDSVDFTIEVTAKLDITANPL